ncbi:hypothetical protein [Candidatus Nitrosocosmicus sp. R]
MRYHQHTDSNTPKAYCGIDSAAAVAATKALKISSIQTMSYKIFEWI